MVSLPIEPRSGQGWYFALCVAGLAVGCSRAAESAGLPAVAVEPRADTSAARGRDHSSSERPSSAPSVAAVESAAPPEPPARLRLHDEHIDWEANDVMRRLGGIAETMTHSEYSHTTLVDERKGIYEFDCSGMVYWLLRRTTPRAASALAYRLDHRPLARDIYRRIASVKADRPRYGWQRLPRVDALEPGDVVAWLKPAIVRSPNTGHTGFVVLPPLRVPEYDNAYLVRIADATSLLHDDDTRVGRNGFGMGTILLVSDPRTGEPIAYGWAGLSWRAFETEIALGRPLE